MINHTVIAIHNLNITKNNITRTITIQQFKFDDYEYGNKDITSNWFYTNDDCVGALHGVAMNDTYMLETIIKNGYTIQH